VAAALGPWVKTTYVLVHAGERFESVRDGRVDILCDPSAEVVAVRDHRHGMELVQDAKLDAYMADRNILAAMLRAGGRPGFELSKRYFSYETYALALPRDDSAFRLLVDKTLARLYRTGKVNAILTKTFGGQPLDEMLSTMFLINALPE
jgi:ABC-type amino acid transport substrate-binding protein